MRPHFSVIVPLLLTVARVAYPQVEAAFPPEPSSRPPEPSSDSPEPSSGEPGASTEGAASDDPPGGKSPDDSRATPAPQRALEKNGQKASESSPSGTPANSVENPYGAPPPPPSSMPGNPYGTVPHRAPTPATNPYMGSAPGETTPQREMPIEETNWSVGGGLTTDPTGAGVGLSYEGSYPPSPRFSSSLLFERRLGPSLFLLVQPRLLYHKGTYEPPNPGLDGSKTEELRLGLEAGLRWVANPGGPVELGMSHLASVEYNQFVQQGPSGFLVFGAESAQADQVVAGLASAFIAERRLIPHLWLRLGVGLFGVHYYSTTILATEEEQDDVTGETTQTEEDSSAQGIRVGLSPSFALQIRLAF